MFLKHLIALQEYQRIEAKNGFQPE